MSSQYKIKGEDNQEFGPVSADELRSWIGQNRCNLNTLVEADGSGNWVKLGSLAEFSANFASPQPTAAPKGDGGVSTVIPYNNKPALIAYYLGVFCIACPPLLCLPAMILSIKGLKNVKANPEVKGTAHAWIGIDWGLFPALSIAVFVLIGMGNVPWLNAMAPLPTFSLFGIPLTIVGGGVALFF